MLGTTLPSLIARFGIDKAAGGRLFIYMTLGIIAGSIVFGPVVDRRGYRGMLLGAGVLLAISLEGIAFAPSVEWLRAAIVLMGFAGGILNGAANALVSDISSAGRGAGLSFLAAFFGLGAVSVPLALGVLPDETSYTSLIAAVGMAVVIPVASFGMTRYPEPKQPQGFPVREGGRLLRDPVMLLMCTMLVLESGVEFTVGGWTTTFFLEELRVSPRAAVLFLSLYWAGMMAGRLALGRILRVVPVFHVLYACTTLVLLSSILLMTTERVAVAATGVFLIGAGFAPTYPLMLGLIGDRYPAISGTAFSVAFAVALSGGMWLPYLAGVLGEGYGMRASLAIVPVMVAVLLILARGLSAKVSR